jgi:hypothetical protein
MAARETKKQHTEEKAAHKVTAAELTAMEKYLARLEAKPSGRFKVSKDGSNLQLRRYRSGAEQKVTLQHVSVAEGGQAIVGNVTQALRKDRQEKAAQEKAATPAPTLPDTNVVPMPSTGKSKEQDLLAVRRKSNK